MSLEIKSTLRTTLTMNQDTLLVKFYKWFTIGSIILYASIPIWLFTGAYDNWDKYTNDAIDLFQDQCQKLVFSVPVECVLK